ncbi:MAG TPA: hypothetical protein VM490_04790 [Armatimonadaceae bacterium]|nr:hypothetical protein [Armatimonadaceae bacterium]
MDRRQFFLTGVAVTACAAGGAAETMAAAQTPSDRGDAPPKKKIDKGPPLAPDLVKAFVGAAHGDLDKVKAMLAEQPRLVNATWDWGGGDFETALGGAAHMGRRDIALYLLERGARLDLFAAAMLGRTEVVRAALAAFPDALKTPGPHGIPLLAHAKAGGKDAEETLRHLESLA